MCISWLDVSVVVLHSLRDFEAMLLVELESCVVADLHVEVDELDGFILLDFLDDVLEQLRSDVVSSVWLQDSESEDV